MYKIGDFAQLGRVPIKTLRYYDEIGLLRPAHVERATGYRYYAAGQLEQLNRVLVFKDLGFSLREIAALLAEGASTVQLRRLLRGQRDQLERHVERERARLARAAARLALLDRGSAVAARDVAVRIAGRTRVAAVRGTLATHDECDALFDELAHGTGARGR